MMKGQIKRQESASRRRIVLCLSIGAFLYLVAAAIGEQPHDDTIPNRPVARGTTFPKIDRIPKAEANHRPGGLPEFDPRSKVVLEMDIRGRDLSRLDLQERLEDLRHATFNNETRWPAANRMPLGFNPQDIAKNGRDPGLEVRALHRQGITGRGVGIAVIDNPLLVGHSEYANRLHLYEEFNIADDESAHWHGTACLSLAGGKTVGVAPESDLYFFAAWPRKSAAADMTSRVQAVRRILQINRQLPQGRRIRVISMSMGWTPTMRGYNDMQAAAEEVERSGILFVTPNFKSRYEVGLMGIGRAPRSNPNDFGQYRIARSYSQLATSKPLFAFQLTMGKWLFVPTDNRTVASSTGADAYAYWRYAGLSWAVPYLAGVYALACQVHPDVTPERFLRLAADTGRSTKLEVGGKTLSFGRVVDPAALLRRLQSDINKLP